MSSGFEEAEKQALGCSHGAHMGRVCVRAVHQSEKETPVHPPIREPGSGLGARVNSQIGETQGGKKRQSNRILTSHESAPGQS